MALTFTQMAEMVRITVEDWTPVTDLWLLAHPEQPHDTCLFGITALYEGRLYRVEATATERELTHTDHRTAKERNAWLSMFHLLREATT